MCSIYCVIAVITFKETFCLTNWQSPKNSNLTYFLFQEHEKNVIVLVSGPSVLYCKTNYTPTVLVSFIMI